MKYKYEEVLDASKPNWFAETKGFVDRHKQVAVINLKPAQVADCMALAQEHDFTCTVLDNDFNVHAFPEVQPSRLGFVHRDSAQRIQES